MGVDHVDDVGVRHHAARRRRLHPYPVGVPDRLEVGQRSGEEAPVGLGIESLLSVEGGDVLSRPIDGVGHDGHKTHLGGSRAEQVVGHTEFLGDDRAVGRADGVEEREDHGVPPQIGQRYGHAVHVDQPESGGRSRDHIGRAVDRFGDPGVSRPADRRCSHRSHPHQENSERTQRCGHSAGVAGVDALPPRAITRSGRTERVCRRRYPSKHRAPLRHFFLSGFGHALGRALHLRRIPLSCRCWSSECEEPADGNSQQGQHRVRIGPGAPPEAEVLDEDPVGHAQHGQHHHRRPEHLAGPQGRTTGTRADE